MKKWLQVVATLALAMCAMVLVNVQDVKADYITSTDGQWLYEADYFNSTCTVKDYFGDAVDLVIPSKIDGLKVTEIFTGDWEDGSLLPNNIESISIPDTVTSIGYASFCYLKNLRTVKLPSKLKSIGRKAFIGCSSLEEITIPKSVTFIDDYAFYESGIKKLVVEGNPITYNNCFSDCDSLEYVSMPKFTGKGSLSGLFYGCDSLKKVDMPQIQVISGEMFKKCISLEEFKFTNKITYIGDYAFANTSLKKVDLSSSLTYLGRNAFDGAKLSELVIPGSLGNGNAEIGTDLTNVDIYALNPDAGLSKVSQTCTIHGFKNSKAYESAKSMGVRFVEIKGGISSAKLKKSGTKSVLSWKKAKGAKSYTIFRYNSSKGVWQKIATTKKTKYTDKSKSAGNKYRVTYTFKQGGKTLTGGIDIQI